MVFAEIFLPAAGYVEPLRPLLLRATAAVLVVAALFSLTGAFLSWRREQKSTWPGMVTVGDQTLNNEEGGKK